MSLVLNDITSTTAKIRLDFPVLNQKINGNQLIYFDNGASNQKPKQVVEIISNYYLHEHSNVHRGVHFLSSEATNKFEESRKNIADFINASSPTEIIFTKGTTDSINLAAYSIGKTYINEGDEVIVTEMEHHSNFVPWQIMCEDKKALFKVFPVEENGDIHLEKLKKIITHKTKILSITHVSNTLGTLNELKEIISFAHQKGCLVFVDGAQAIAHLPVDVQDLDADFYAFSSHKLYGPTGLGVLYGKEKLLLEMKPYQSGGGMIKKVTAEKTTYNDLPEKFEAGTPHIAGVIGLNEAVNYIKQIGFDYIKLHEKQLMDYALLKLNEINEVQLIGNPTKRIGTISFLIKNAHPYDVGTLLDQQGIAVRTGHHCTQPLMDKYQIPGTIRISFGIYNTMEEIDTFIIALKKSIKLLA
jgi:cysteine desulfurase / selenocysteine lyase